MQHCSIAAGTTTRIQTAPCGPDQSIDRAVNMTDTNANSSNSMSNSNSNSTSTSTSNRQSESPARTIDSHDSTTGSLDTIVDRSLSISLSREQMLAQSVNTTNEQEEHDSLTNSQIAMIQRSGNTASASDDDAPTMADRAAGEEQQQQQQQDPQLSALQLDAQSHIYSSPVYAVSGPDQKPLPLKLTAAALLESATATNANGNGNVNMDEDKKPKLITHEEFQKQLQATAASRAATIDSRISKKQRLPPELIKMKDGDQDYAAQQQQDPEAAQSKKNKKKSKHQQSKALDGRRKRSPFPVQIALGTVQLILAISLVALGALLIGLEASLAMAGCGIWTGLTAAVTGSMGVVGMRKTQTAFLALSLVCIATSTLALAISGVGLSRDINRMEEKFELMSANDEISAASGLIFTLFLHFIVSVVSVYRCALHMCARNEVNDLNDVIISTNPHSGAIALDQDKIEQYIKAMSLTGNEKENPEKLAAMWMYATQMGGSPQAAAPTSMGKLTPPALARPIMLIPASNGGSTSMLASQPPPPAPRPMLMASPPLVGHMQYAGMTLPYMRAPSSGLVYAHPMAPGSLHGTYRTHKSSKSADINSQRRRRRAAAANGHGLPPPPRSGKMNANRRQRRKSEADVVDGAGQAFTYTGLDRVIADSFLERQEQSNAGSHVDYSSSASSSAAGETFGGVAQPPSRSSSKTKIVCRDVTM